MDETALGGGERHTGESGVYALKKMRGPGPKEKPGETGMEVLGGEMSLGCAGGTRGEGAVETLVDRTGFPPRKRVPRV